MTFKGLFRPQMSEETQQVLITKNSLNALLHYLVNCEIVMQKTITRLALELANNLLT